MTDPLSICIVANAPKGIVIVIVIVIGVEVKLNVQYVYDRDECNTTHSKNR